VGAVYRRVNLRCQIGNAEKFAFFLSLLFATANAANRSLTARLRRRKRGRCGEGGGGPDQVVGGHHTPVVGAVVGPGHPGEGLAAGGVAGTGDLVGDLGEELVSVHIGRIAGRGQRGAVGGPGRLGGRSVEASLLNQDLQPP